MGMEILLGQMTTSAHFGTGASLELCIFSSLQRSISNYFTMVENRRLVKNFKVIPSSIEKEDGKIFVFKKNRARGLFLEKPSLSMQKTINRKNKVGVFTRTIIKAPSL
jgi:uncharacterized FlgJ-related protein